MSALHSGFSQREITPDPTTVFLDGYGFRLAPAEGVRDHIYAKVFVCQTGADRFALIALDMCGMSPKVYDYLAGHIESMTGFSRSEFALCCTHTHSAPACGVLDGLPLNWDWLARVGEEVSVAIEEACSSLRPGHLTFAIPDQKLSTAFNRRFREPIDRRVRCGLFVSEDGIPLGMIASASCHPVVNTSQNISADYISVLYQRAEELWPGVPVLFLNGRGADVDPYNKKQLSRENLLLMLGNEFADAVIEGMNNMLADHRESQPEISLTAINRRITVPMSPWLRPDEYRTKISCLTERYLSEKDSVQKHFVLRELDYHHANLAHALNGDPTDLQVPLQIFMLGTKTVFIMLPFEIMTLTGNTIEQLLIDRGFPAASIYVVGNSNSVNGYLATREEFSLGGYEVEGSAHWYGTPQCTDESEGAVIQGIEAMIEGRG